jgi:hypothetical protein
MAKGLCALRILCFRKYTTTIQETLGVRIGIGIGIETDLDSDTDPDPDAQAPKPRNIFMHLGAPTVHGDCGEALKLQMIRTMRFEAACAISCHPQRGWYDEGPPRGPFECEHEPVWKPPFDATSEPRA